MHSGNLVNGLGRIMHSPLARALRITSEMAVLVPVGGILLVSPDGKMFAGITFEGSNFAFWHSKLIEKLCTSPAIRYVFIEISFPACMCLTCTFSSQASCSMLSCTSLTLLCNARGYCGVRNNSRSLCWTYACIYTCMLLDACQVLFPDKHIGSGARSCR